MNRAESTFRLMDAAVTISADTGSMTVPWSAFKEVLGCKGCWLLRNASNRYVTLPTEGVPSEALQFVRSKIPIYKSIARGADAA